MTEDTALGGTMHPDHRRQSIQQRLERVRAPRVHLTYPVDLDGRAQQRELPFEVLILADLCGTGGDSRGSLRERKVVSIDLETFDAVLQRFEPRAVFEVGSRVTPECDILSVDLRFRSLDDFKPDSVVMQIGPLADALAERTQLTNRILHSYRDGSAEECETQALEARRAELDAVLSWQLSEVMHHPAFQRIEATWRGLHFLVNQTETNSTLRLSLLAATRDELIRDVARSIDFEESGLFKQVCEGAYGTFAGGAIGLILGGYEFQRDARDLELLEQISHIAAAAHAPFIAAAAPSFFGIQNFAEIGGLRDLSMVGRTAEHSKWNEFRRSEDARYVGLTLPRVLLRRPYGFENPIEAFDFREHVSQKEEFLWGSAAYALGTCVTNAFAKYNWCASIRGVESGGLVEGLPTGAFPYSSDDGDRTGKCPVEVAISDRHEKEISDLGFIPLVHRKNTDCAVFFSMMTCCQPREYFSDDTSANVRLSAQLQYVLTASRFAHFMKCMMRDHVGSFRSRSDIQAWLDGWLQQYVTSDDGLSLAVKARFPLREARVDVTEVAGKPGKYAAIAFLRPHFQLDELSVSMRLVVELPPPER